MEQRKQVTMGVIELIRGLRANLPDLSDSFTREYKEEVEDLRDELNIYLQDYEHRSKNES